MAQMGNLSFAPSDDRWKALATRSLAVNDFFYGVKTTRIYCRPTCASRLPKPENVQFFESCAAAEAAGFRACKRCQPDARSPQQQQADRIAAICREIDASDASIPLKDLAARAGLSPFHFQRVFKAIVGMTPKQYAVAKRASKVRQTLTTSHSVTEAVYEAGFGTGSSFYREATEMLGMQPRTYRKGADGVTIRYAVKPCDLGWVLVAATDRGICAIEFGDDSESAIQPFQARFPNATLEANDPEFDRWVEGVIALIHTPQQNLDLPLDIQGTVFQQQVWQALRAIPPGQTVSYSQIAERLGKPKAVRAVASACAANQLAVAIPCHRVIGSRGALTGYRWGVHRKQALLQREAIVDSEDR